MLSSFGFSIAEEAAAAWLHNPVTVTKRRTYARTLEIDLQQNGEWTVPDYGKGENPADE